MINWTHKEEGTCEGSFESSFFKNDGDNELYIYIESESVEDYAEKCVAFINNISNPLIDEICKGIIESIKEDGYYDYIELENADNVREILDYCWFTAVYVNKPNNENEITFIVEGEGDWGEVIGFVIKEGRLGYAGVDYFEQL